MLVDKFSVIKSLKNSNFILKFFLFTVESLCMRNHELCVHILITICVCICINVPTENGVNLCLFGELQISSLTRNPRTWCFILRTVIFSIRNVCTHNTMERTVIKCPFILPCSHSSPYYPQL